MKKKIATLLRTWAESLSPAPVKVHRIIPTAPPHGVYRDYLTGHTASLRKIKIDRQYDMVQVMRAGKSYADCKKEVQRDLLEGLLDMDLDRLVRIEDYSESGRGSDIDVHGIRGELLIYVWDETRY